MTDEKKNSMLKSNEIMSSIEEQARAIGWKPKEELELEPTDWVGAKEFLDRKFLYDRIHKLEQHNRRLIKQIEEIKDMCLLAISRSNRH